MGGDELQVEREALKRNAKGFGDGSKALRRVFDQLNSALSAEGDCWGNDNTGKAFASEYTGTRDSALKTFPSLEKSLNGIESGVQKMGTNYDQAEHASGG
ncbi:MAG: hypothetical protein JWR24_3513 [Actinoallomurus sp.]|nr:hypothetical protein [Actinoallomurus sp.]